MVMFFSVDMSCLFKSLYKINEEKISEQQCSKAKDI